MTALALGPTARAATFQKVFAFPTGSSVRVQITPTTHQAKQKLNVSATIDPVAGGTRLWSGELGDLEEAPAEFTIRQLQPSLWSPATPTLYTLTLVGQSNGKEVARQSLRIGFRDFEIKNAQFHLNGKPIFLRGIAINPPTRTIPDAVGFSKQFALDYVRFVKSQNVNIIRLPEDSQEWFDACDEVGVMLYQGIYGSPPAKIGERFSTKQTVPEDVDQTVAAYKHFFETYAHHPSIVIYILANELPYTGTRGAAWHEFLSKVHPILAKWDPTRPFIGNAGYGQGREGDVNDVHRYWGWYYNSFLTYYNLRDVKLFGDYEKIQPLTFTECVGSFTGPHGGFNLVEKKQLAAQLGWTGWAEDQRRLADEHQCRVLKHATESFRRLRPINPRLSGVMPFTILFDHWKGIQSFSDMKPKPAMAQMARSYQPVLLSWELWTGQVYAGSTIHPVAHLINDAEDRSDLTGAMLEYAIQNTSGEPVASHKLSLPDIGYYGTWSQRLELKIPPNVATGTYTLRGTVIREGKRVSENSERLFIAASEWKQQPPGQPAKSIALYDPPGRTADSFKRIAIPFLSVADVASTTPAPQVLAIGEDAWDHHLQSRSEQLNAFVRSGGRILLLSQDPQKVRPQSLDLPIEFFSADVSANDPTYPPAQRPTRDQSNLNPQRPDHPVLEGLSRDLLTFWSDYTNWDQTKPGFPRVYPVTRGFKLVNADAMAKTAILLNYDRGLEGIALAEIFDGTGSILISGLDLIGRIGLDPAADRMLRNLVLYTASDQPHEVHPKVTKPIVWGDYGKQQSVLHGPEQGLLVNVEWTPPPTDPTTKPLTRDEGAWNTKPSDQYLPRGVRPFGPYGWSTGTAPRVLNRDSPTGSGFFWASIPAGRKSVVTKVRNPTSSALSFAVSVGAVTNSAAPATSVSPDRTSIIRTPLPPNTTNVRVNYTGDKNLVILETAFE